MMIRLGRVPGDTVFPRASGMNMASAGGGIHTDLPGQRASVVGLGKQPGVHGFPHTCGMQVDKEVVDPPPRAVALWDVPPWAAGADPKEDAVDQGSSVPGAGSSPP